MAKNEEVKRVYGRVPIDLYRRMEATLKRRSMSVSDYITEAVELKIRYDAGEFAEPFETQRVNQLIDAITVLSSNVANLESVTVSGFDSLLGLTRGDNYLLEDDGGEY